MCDVSMKSILSNVTLFLFLAQYPGKLITFGSAGTLLFT